MTALSSVFQNKQLWGWVQAFLAVLVFLGLCNVFGRYSIVVFETNPFIYSCVAFSSAALVLTLYAGRGPLGKETMSSIDTWVYGLVLMGGYVIGMLLFAYVTSTEGTILQKVSVFLSVFASWMFLGRKPDRFQLLGTAIILMGIALVYSGLDRATIGVVTLLALSYGGLQAARIFTAELHRPHAVAAQQKDPKARARVISFVMFTMSLIFTGFCLIMCWVQYAQGTRFSEFLPVFADFTYPPNIFLGMVMGVLIVVPLRVLEFSSAHVIKAANFTTVTALSALGTMFWEWATSPLTGLSIKELSGYDVVAGGLITSGALVIAFSRPWIARRNQQKLDDIYVAAQNPQEVADSRDILVETLEHFSMDIQKTAQALGVSTHAVKALMQDTQRQFAFKNLGHVQRYFREGVAGRDGLTGLLNRNAYKRRMTGAMNHDAAGVLLYIDLDKFKPINDTYGHDAGDAVLIEVASRLRAVTPQNALVCRMGGDEFSVYVPGSHKADDLCKALETAFEAPVEFAGIEGGLPVGGSIGVAQYPADGATVEELISVADKGMYGVKRAAK